MKKAILLITILLGAGPLTAPAAAPLGGASTDDKAAADTAHGADAFGSGPASRDPLLDEPAGDLKGQPVYNPEGDSLGTVDAIVRQSTDRGVYAVISVGGFLGIGDRQVTVPAQQLDLQNDRLVLGTTMTEDELKNEPTYRPEAFEPVDADQTLRAAIDERIPTIAAQVPEDVLFDRLDDDGDGRLSHEEASADPSLPDDWKRIDSNNDGWIERSEFSAFEKH